MRKFTLETVDGEILASIPLCGSYSYHSDDYTVSVQGFRAEDVAAALSAAPPPKRPEGAEAITSAVWGMEIPNEAGAAGIQIAESLAKHGYKIVRATEDGEGER